MNPSLTPTTVGGMKGLVIENDKLRVVITPEFGARIVSIIYKPTETEFVWHNPGVPLMRHTHKTDVEDLSGLFDCVPTCENCKFKNWQLPMLGEVASEPWRMLKTSRKTGAIMVELQRKCEIYPLLVQKTIKLTKKDSKLELNYMLTNLSDEKLEYHYSGHNTLAINPNFRIVLPPEVNVVKRGMAITDRLGNLGDEVPWPMTTDKDGKPVDLSSVGQPTEGTGENLYTPALKRSWAAALNERRGEAIAFSFDARVFPYVLVWINRGGYQGYYHIALEPSTGRPDNLNVAVNDWKNYAVLEANSNASWTTRIFLGHNVKHIQKVTPNGIIQ